MGSSFLKLLPRSTETKAKNKNQTNNQKQQETESNEKYKTHHGPLTQEWIDTGITNLI